MRTEATTVEKNWMLSLRMSDAKWEKKSECKENMKQINVQRTLAQSLCCHAFNDGSKWERKKSFE